MGSTQRLAPVGLVLACLLGWGAAPHGALAMEAPAAPPAKEAAPAKDAEPAYDGPEIAWARSWPEAAEEAAERNVAIYVHSHGST